MGRRLGVALALTVAGASAASIASAPGGAAAAGAIIATQNAAGAGQAEPDAPGRIVIGSKNFTESRILGEMLAMLVEDHTNLSVEHRSGLGGTLVCFAALQSGEIDLYPEYTGTGWSRVSTKVLGSGAVIEVTGSRVPRSMPSLL